MAKLKALGRYSASNSKGEPVSYVAGEVIHVTDSEAARLLRDSPGTFEVLEGLIVAGGPDEFVTPPADPTPAPAPVRGQAPLHEGSVVADERVRNPDGTTTPAPAASRSQEEPQALEDADPGDTTSGPPAGAGAPDEPPQTPESVAAADATGEDEGDVNPRTMNRAALVALIREQGLAVKHVGKTTDAIRSGVKNALDARAKGGLTR